MKALVTGAAGFIGYYVARQLIDRGNEVVLVDNFVRGHDDELYRTLARHPRATALDLDLADPSMGQYLPNEVDVVFHFAALNGTQNFYDRPFDVLRLSTLPTFALIEKYSRSQLSRFVYAGSSESYATTITRFNWPVPTSENVPLCIDDPFNPRWSYAASKMHGEVLTIHGCQQFGLPFTVVRYHNVYGPRMGDKHVVPDFLARAREGVYCVHGHEDTRSFLYIDDAVDATIQLACTADAAGELVNVGSPREETIENLARLMMDICGFEGELDLFPSPDGSVRRRVPDLTKLIRLTGFSPNIPLEEGLARAATFYLDREVRIDQAKYAEVAVTSA